MDLKIGSINVRGLGDQVKRREIFNWLRAKKYSVYFIHKTIRMICGPNGAMKLCSAAAPVQRQVLSYFLINSTFQISETYSDPEGRFIICDLTVNDIYPPNNDDSNFFTSVFSHLADFKSDEIIIGGDFNFVLDVEKDKKGWPCKDS